MNRPTTPAIAADQSPKVVERPEGTAVKSASDVDACLAHPSPNTQVHTDTIAMNPQTLAAMDTLSSMGVHSTR